MKLAVPPKSLAIPPWSPGRPATTNVVQRLPFLWRRVLFPGQVQDCGHVRLAALLLLLSITSLLVLPRLDFQRFEPDEGRYAQIPKEMLDRGDWLTPTLQGEPYLDKPPLFYWLVMLAYCTF